MRKHLIFALLAAAALVSACIFGGGNPRNNDPEPELCGNARLDPGETCDPCDTFACPSGGCGIWAQQGSAATCDLRCVENGQQTACGDGDGCCPSGCDESNDDDCSANCGNGVIDEGEVCDPCPDGCPDSPCAPSQQSGDPTTCNLVCEQRVDVPGCCGGNPCGEMMACVDGQCIEPECFDDSDCAPTGPNARCVDGVCIEPRGCIDAENCLPWQVCSDAGECIDPDSCDASPDPEGYCAFSRFEPGNPTPICVDGNCDTSMAMRFCNNGSGCAGWEQCSTSQCVIAQSCDAAEDPGIYCIFMTGDSDSLCLDNRCVD